ncbi:hypothetical protein ABE236_22925 [Priestia endophytica]
MELFLTPKPFVALSRFVPIDTKQIKYSETNEICNLIIFKLILGF